MCAHTLCVCSDKDLVQNGMSITGLSYKTLDYGPVLEHWSRISAIKKQHGLNATLLIYDFAFQLKAL